MKKTLLKFFVICVFTNLSLTAQDITTGLVFHLSCDSAGDILDNGSVTESSSSAAVGTVVGGLTSVADPSGTANGAFQFSAGSYINFDIGDIQNLPLGDVSTSGRGYSLWMKTPSTNSSRVAAFGYGTQAARRHVHLNISHNTPSQLDLGFWSFEMVQPTGSIVDVLDDNWHHVAISVMKTATGYSAEYYVDNVFAGTGSITSTNVANAQTSTDDPDFRIGGRNDFGEAALQYLGSLDDIRFYDRALSTADVQALFVANGGTLSTSSPKTAADFKVFPTVVSDILKIESSVDLNELSIVNINGVTIKKYIELNKKEINVSNLSSGLYFLVGKSSIGTSTSKFIKK